MAKPIRATPELKGLEADKFIKKMIIVEKSALSKVDRNLVKQIAINSAFFKQSQELQLS